MSNKIFRITVIIFVTLIGAGFGTWAGKIYEDISLPIGTIMGIISGFGVSLIYLWLLRKISKIWKVIVLGSLIGLLCGIISTTCIHGTIFFLNSIYKWQNLTSGEAGSIYPAIVFVCNMIGAGAGLVAGFLCSWGYVIFVGINNANRRDV
jgi:hypothetical protein